MTVKSANPFLPAFIIVAIIACNNEAVPKKVNDQQDFILEEKYLLPEGVAFDTVTRSIFISSTHKRKIVRI